MGPTAARARTSQPAWEPSLHHTTTVLCINPRGLFQQIFLQTKVLFMMIPHHAWSSRPEGLACRPPRRLVLLCDQIRSTWQTYLPLNHPHLGVKYLQLGVLPVSRRARGQLPHWYQQSHMPRLCRYSPVSQPPDRWLPIPRARPSSGPVCRSW